MSIQRIAVRAFQVAAVSGIVFGAVAPTAAHATCYAASTGCEPSDPGGTTQVRGTTAAESATESATKSATKSATLPFTGGDVAGMAAIGAGAVLAGTVLVRQSRRRVTV